MVSDTAPEPRIKWLIWSIKGLNGDLILLGPHGGVASSST